MRCSECGAEAGTCEHGGGPSGLELDFSAKAPPSAPKVAPAPMPMAPLAPLPQVEPSYSRQPLPPANSGGIVSDNMVKIAIAAGAVVIVIGLIWLGVRKLRGSVESQMDEAATRPYPAPNRLIIASVTKDYASTLSDDGAIVLRKTPTGPSLGLTAWYASEGMPPANFLDKGIAATKGEPSYRAMETPTDPCRSDAETSIATLGELSWNDSDNVTLWTCTITKKSHSYFLAWAARSKDVDDVKQRLTSMVKGTQLVSNDLCSLNVINGGCMSSAASLIAAIVENARK